MRRFRWDAREVCSILYATCRKINNNGHQKNQGPQPSSGQLENQQIVVTVIVVYVRRAQTTFARPTRAHAAGQRQASDAHATH